jgi:hypothetical protein
MDIEHDTSDQWGGLLSSALDDMAHPSIVPQDTNSVRALLAENARLRNLAIQLSSILGNRLTEDNGARQSARPTILSSRSIRRWTRSTADF